MVKINHWVVIKGGYYYQIYILDTTEYIILKNIFYKAIITHNKSKTNEYKIFDYLNCIQLNKI